MTPLALVVGVVGGWVILARAFRHKRSRAGQAAVEGIWEPTKGHARLHLVALCLFVSPIFSILLVGLGPSLYRLVFGGFIVVAVIGAILLRRLAAQPPTGAGRQPLAWQTLLSPSLVRRSIAAARDRRGDD